jgi:phosphoribosylglycinamide formyltransferase-1
MSFLKHKIRLAIFASGSGSNAENIIRHFIKHPKIEVHSLLCNKPDAEVLKRIEPYNVNPKVFNREQFYELGDTKSYLDWYEVDYLILAGFLWKMPGELLEYFPDHIINIHPALLPKHGGKGMYGMNVHRAVLAAGDTETGITIHLVNEGYDEGKILFQAKTKIDVTDTEETIDKKVRGLELEHYPKFLEEYILAQEAKNVVP